MAESVTPEAQDSSPQDSGPRSLKRQKIAIACDVCRAKKIRCDGTRPVCTPCRKRDRELLCQYSLDSRTPSGAPSKGYVHHLELKLRELQAEKVGSGSPQTDSTTFSSSHGPSQATQQDIWGQSSHPSIQRHNSNSAHTNTLPPLTEIAERNGANGINSWNVPPSLPSHAQPSNLQSSNTHYRRSSDAVPQHVPFPPRLDMGHTTTSWRPPVKEETDLTNEDVDYQSSGAQVFTRQITLAIDRKLGTRSEPLLPGTRPRASSNHQKKSLPINYLLPPKDQADYFVHIYWTLVHPMFPILDRQAFHKAYADLCSPSSPVDVDDPIMVSQINLIFALGCQHSETFEMDTREATAKTFFDRATELLNLDSIDSGSLETVQCFLLMVHYLQSTKYLARNWMLVGIAIRMAQALRLHRVETSAQQDPKRRELYRRVWHGCLFMDRIFSMTFDRPTMMDNNAMSSVPLPLPIDEEYLPGPQPADQPSSMDYYVQSLKLINLMEHMLSDVQTVERESKRPDDQYELLFGHPEDVDVVSILKHDRIMMAFSRRLPRHLQVDTPETRRSELFVRQANVLRSRYLHSRILLFRSVLSRFCLAQNDLTVSSVAPKMDESLPQRLALAASTLCVRAAHENIDLLYTNLDQSFRALGSLPTSWFCVLYLYTAATVLQAARLRPIVEMGVSDFSITTSWSHALEALEKLTKVNSMARRCLAALQILSDKVSESSGRSGGPSRAEPASAPAGMESQGGGGHGPEEQGLHPSQSPWASAGAAGGTNAGRQEDGTMPDQASGLGLDLDGYDFDIGDMTWLTTTKILTWM